MKKGFSLIELLIVLGIVSFIVWTMFTLVSSPSNNSHGVVATQESSEVSNSKAVQAAIDEGYTDIQSQGNAFLGCGKDDSVFTSEHLSAKNSNGKTLELTVCCGGFFFKSCTVRH